MELSFWAKTSGTWINLGTVFLGTVLGLGLRSRLPKAMQEILTQGLGLLTLFLGMSLAGRMLAVQSGAIGGVIIALVGLILGGLLGEWLGLEAWLTAWGDRLKGQFRGQGRFTEGFVTASLLFCVGPMALLGSLNNGLEGDATLLLIKATMDGIAAIALTGSYGVGVGFSGLSLLIYQGSISLGAGLLGQALPDPAQDPHVLLATGVGGLMIVGIGLNFLEVARIRVASFLPALAVTPLLWVLLEALTQLAKG